MVKRKPVEHYGDLYIPMDDVADKRKNLLLAIKNSLLMQEEYDRVLQIRAKKAEILKTIKKGMGTLNTDYINIQKYFPNIKNVLNNTEKEIDILESEISLLKGSSKSNSKEITKLTHYEERIQSNLPLVPNKHKKKAKPKTVVKKPMPLRASKHLSKKERVKHNLKALESKLKEL